jgi:hypothetical protein
LPVTLVCAQWLGKIKDRTIKVLKITSLFLVTYIISEAMFNILRLGPNFHLLKSRNYDYVYPIQHIFVNLFDPLVPHFKDVVGWLKDFGPWPLTVFIIVGTIVGLRRYFKETIILLAFSMVPVFAQCMYAKVFTARYLLFIVPYLVILAALSFKVRYRIFALGLYFVLALYLFTAFKQDYYLLVSPEKMLLPRGERTGYLEEWTAGQGLKEASIYLKDEFNKDQSKKIVVGTDGYFGTMPDGLQIYLNDTPQIIITGVEVKFTEVPRPLLESSKAGNKTFLLVNSSRFFIPNPEEEGLTLIHEYLRAIKPDGTREKLLFFILNSNVVKNPKDKSN